MMSRWPYLILLMATLAAAQMQHPAMSASHPGGSIPMHSKAMVECPWLTRGTAAAVLGGHASLALSMDGDSGGSCIFRGLQKPSQTLTIIVSSMAPHACRKKAEKLTGIANWASLCNTSRWHHRHTESVSGRARTIYFTVTLSFQQKKKWRKRDADVEHVAGIVAGNLY